MERIFPAAKYSINLETTNKCVLSCFMCCQPVIQKQRGFIDIDLVKKIAEDLSEIYNPPSDLRVQLIGQGEPLLHPRIFEIIGIVKAKGFRVDFVTNAVLLDKEKAKTLLNSPIDEIEISFYGWDRDSYKKIHGVDNFVKVLQNVIMLLHQKPKFRVSLHLLRCQVSTGIIERLEKLWGYFPVDIVATYQVRNIRNIINIRDSNNDEQQIIRETDAVFSKACINTLPIIRWDGLVSPCVYDYNAECTIGDIKKQTYAEILNGIEKKKFEDAAMTGKIEEVYGTVFCQLCSDVDTVNLGNGHYEPLMKPPNKNSALLGRKGGDDFLQKYFPIDFPEKWAEAFNRLLFNISNLMQNSEHKS